MPLTPPRYRTVFFVFLILWTIALLMPIPGASVRVLGGEKNSTLFSKSLHVVSYAFLTLLGGRTAYPRRKMWLVLALLSFHTFATEFLQQFVGRGASLRDVGFDHIGIAVGFLLGIRQWQVLLRRESEAAP